MLFLVMMEVFSKMMKRAEGTGLFRDFRADGRRDGGVCVVRIYVFHMLESYVTILCN